MTVSHWRAAAVLSGGLILLPLQAAHPASTASATRHAASHASVQPQSVAALRNMSAYLRSLQSFQIRVATQRDEIDANGKKVRFNGTIDYRVRKPDRFTIVSNETGRMRELFYDGKTLTLFTPSNGFYANVQAPPTIRETLRLAADRYEIHPPLVELFKWGTGEDTASELQSGRRVGVTLVNGQPSDEYAFRSKTGVAWRIWIAQGDKPVPVRVALTPSRGPRLEFRADLTWTPSQQFADNTFIFVPPAGSRQIGIASNQ
jgi:hypothetical protein